IAALKKDLRAALAAAWLSSVDGAVAAMKAWTPDPKKTPNDGPLAAWVRLSKRPADQWPAEWNRLKDEDADRAKKLEAFRSQPVVLRWDLRGPDAASWLADGAGLA